MKKILFVFFIIIISCNYKSQDKIDLSQKNISISSKDTETRWTRILLNNPNKWGVIDEDSIIVIPFEYDFLNPFDENKLAYAKNKGKELYINIKGEVIIPPIYEKLGLFSEGLVIAVKNKKYGILDVSGKIKIPFVYDNLNPFYQGLAQTSIKGKYGFINKEGEVIIPIIYNSTGYSHADNIVIVSNGKKWAFFNNSGKQLSDFLYDKIFDSYNLEIKPPSNLSAVTTYFKNGAVLVIKNSKYEFLNEEIKPAFPNNKFDSASVFDTYQNAIIKNNGKYGMIKPSGEFKVPLEYNFIEYFDSNHLSSEYYNARKGKVYHIFNRDLREIGQSYEPVYNDFSNDTPFIIFKNLKSKYGMVSSKGEVIIPFEYDELFEIKGTDFFKVSQKNKLGVVSKKGKIKIPVQYNDLYSLYDKFDDEELRAKSLFIVDGKKVIDINNQVIIDNYASVEPIFYNRNKLIVSRNKKIGIIDINEKTLLPLEYDEVSNWVEYGPEKRHIVKKNGKFGMVEYETFKEKIPLIYDFVFVARDKVFAGKDNKFGVLDLNNKIICSFIYDEIKPIMGFGFGENKIYAKKSNKFYEINVKGGILNTISEKAYKQNTKKY